MTIAPTQAHLGLEKVCLRDQCRLWQLQGHWSAVVAMPVTRQGRDFPSEDPAHRTLYTRGGLLPCAVTGLTNKLSCILWVGGTGDRLLMSGVWWMLWDT